MDQVKENPQGFVDEYRSRFGDHFNPDNAAELFPEYAASPESRSNHRIAVAGAANRRIRLRHNVLRVPAMLQVLTASIPPVLR
jgi:hypothetical protein